MANIIKIDNSVLKRQKRIEKKRKQNTKEIKVYFLIVCEGEKTEPNYFKSFKTNVKSYVYTIDTLGEGSNTKDLVNRTIKARDRSSQLYDSVWAVFDRDSFSPDNFNGAIQIANNNNVKVGWSNEAFELWYLLHFQYRNTSMSRVDYKKAIEDEINARITAGSKSKKTKKFDAHTCENYAIHNPCTLIHILVKELNGDSEELIQQIKNRDLS